MKNNECVSFSPQEKEAERIQHLWLRLLTVVLFSVFLSKKVRQKAETQKYNFSVKLQKRKIEGKQLP